jgi:hypothetical protein
VSKISFDFKILFAAIIVLYCSKSAVKYDNIAALQGYGHMFVTPKLPYGISIRSEKPAVYESAILDCRGLEILQPQDHYYEMQYKIKQLRSYCFNDTSLIVCYIDDLDSMRACRLTGGVPLKSHMPILWFVQCSISESHQIDNCVTLDSDLGGRAKILLWVNLIVIFFLIYYMLVLFLNVRSTYQVKTHLTPTDIR